MGQEGLIFDRKSDCKKDNIGEKLGLLLEPIKNTTYKHRKHEAELLDKRVNFIQAEINSLVNKEDGDDYWDSLCVRLGELMPSPVMNTDTPENNSEILEEIQPDIVAEEDNDIPVLSQKIRIDKNSSTIAYITLTPLQNEIKRLKRIVGRHFGMLSDMKQAIIENKQDPEKAFKLPKALKELQIVHVQLTRSVKALKEENARITKLLTTENSVAGGSTNLMEDNKQKALDSIRQNQPPQSPPRRRSAKN